MKPEIEQINQGEEAQKYSKLRKVAVIAGGALALGLNAPVMVDASELGPNPGSPESQNRNPIFNRIDKRMMSITKEMKDAIAHHKNGYYTETITDNGKKSVRLVASRKSAIGYTQVISYIHPGKKAPYTMAVILGAPKPRFKLGKDFQSMDGILINENKPNDYTYFSFSHTKQGEWLNIYCEKDGTTNKAWIDDGPDQTFTDKQAGLVFDTFTDFAAKIIKSDK